MAPVRKGRLFRFSRMISRFSPTFLSSFLSRLIRFPISRLSVSNWVSPGPLLPIPPAILERCVHMLVSLGRRYFSCANSTWSLASAVWARIAKMSRISAVLSKTLTSSIFSRFRFCAGDSSSSAMIASQSLVSSMALSSSTFPFPI